MLSLQVVAPILYWESTTFSRPAIALICFGAIALFPSVLLPSSPFMWLAGMTFGYLYGFLIITVGMSIGMSLPYFIGSTFHCRIHVPLVYVTRHVSLVYVTCNVLVWLLAGLVLPRTSQTLVYMLFRCNGHRPRFFRLTSVFT